MDKLNIGCGKDWKEQKGYEGMDIVDFGQKYVNDITKKWPIDSESVAEIRAWNVLEHVSPKDLITVMNEAHRVLKPEGVLDIIVPTFPNVAVDDPTHQSMWEVELIKGDKINLYIFWNDKSPKSYFTQRKFSEYIAGKRPRNADYGLEKWQIENKDGQYTWEITAKHIHIRLMR